MGNSSHSVRAHVYESQGLDLAGGGHLGSNILAYDLAGLHRNYVLLGVHGEPDDRAAEHHYDPDDDQNLFSLHESSSFGSFGSFGVHSHANTLRYYAGEAEKFPYGRRAHAHGLWRRVSCRL